MTVWACDVEEGNFNDFDSTLEGGGLMAVTGGAALGGTNYGISFTMDSTDLNATKLLSAPASGKVRFRFYIDPNNSTISVGNMHCFVLRCDGSLGGIYYISRLHLEYDGSNYELEFRAYDDAGSYYGGNYDILNAENYVEVYAVRATNNSSGDGEAYMWINGSPVYSKTDLDNYDLWDTIHSLQFRCDTPGTNSGTYFMDELVANDTGDLIGPVEAGGATLSISFNAVRGVRITY